MLKNWDLIIHKLCEEVSTHDVLEIVLKHVSIYIEDLKTHKMSTEKAEQARKHLEAALSLLNPEG